MNYFLCIFLFIFSIPTLTYGQNLSKKSTPPNIIIYLADDQNVWDYGVHGNNQVDTSNYDQLVREGMQFSNAYTAQAICAPSRSQLFTGLFPMKNGCMANHLPVKNVDDINDYFKEIGYEVVLAGKGHIKPSSVFNWTKFFPISKNRALPVEDVKKFIEKNCDYVGDNFAYEARKIYYGKKDKKPIYGKATKEDVVELNDEGIEVASIPWVEEEN